MILDIVRHGLQHVIRGAMGMGRALRDVAEPDMGHRLGEILLGERLHGGEVLPVGLALDVVLVDDAGAVEGDLEPFCVDGAAGIDVLLEGEGAFFLL